MYSQRLYPETFFDYTFQNFDTLTDFFTNTVFVKSNILNRYMRKRSKVNASIFDSALSHIRRSNESEKKKKIACPLLDVFARGQVSSPRLYRLKLIV